MVSRRRIANSSGITDESREWYKDTNYSTWRRSSGEFIAVTAMGKFHLIKAAKKIQRLKLEDLEVYTGIKDQLKGKYKANDSEWMLGGAL